MYGAVNQRASVGSTSASMPFDSATSMRSFHIGHTSGGLRLVVSARTRLFSRPGFFSARVCPIIAPIEMPTQCVSLTPRPASRPAASSARSSSVYSPVVTSVLPCPRVSKRSTLKRLASSATCSSHMRESQASEWLIVSQGPAPSIV